MLLRWSIRAKLLLCITLMALMVSALTFSGCQGAYAYRGLARSVSRRTNESPLASELSRHCGNLRNVVSRARSIDNFPGDEGAKPVNVPLLREEFRTQLVYVEESLRRYREQLNAAELEDSHIDNVVQERAGVQHIEATLERVHNLNQAEQWVLDPNQLALLADELDRLVSLSEALPGFLQERMHDLAGEVRGQYRAWILLTWVTSSLACVLLVSLVGLFYRTVFVPLDRLIRGSQRVASGDFAHQIELGTQDEMAGLAHAMNDMTRRFREIRDDLDRQVQERTRELIRGERLASVGFLAAGVAHEINNPLAAVAMCAESLERRLHDIMQADDQQPDDQHNPEIAVLRNYLRTIQDEAFRCQGITEKLLDFSRVGDKEKQRVNLAELVTNVIDMVGHIGRYRDKTLACEPSPPVFVQANAQEIKQVLLNLVVNGLDCVEPGGAVTVSLASRDDEAEILVADNGCGMDAEVLEHLFEPFFTRKRQGQGTGLGLSISFRIVADHHGRLEARSAGPGQGSQFRIILPRVKHEEIPQRQLQAA